MPASTPAQQCDPEHAARPVFSLFFTGKARLPQAVSTSRLQYGPVSEREERVPKGKKPLVSFPWGCGVKCPCTKANYPQHGSKHRTKSSAERNRSSVHNLLLRRVISVAGANSQFFVAFHAHVHLVE